MSQESKTPRTDAVWTSAGVTERNLYRLSCDLERELAAVTEERDALIASARIKEANSGWRPIETEPKDGSDILVTNGKYVEKTHWYRPYLNGKPDPYREPEWWQNDMNGGFGGYCGPLTPTHWMPLPAPPTTEPGQ